MTEYIINLHCFVWILSLCGLVHGFIEGHSDTGVYIGLIFGGIVVLVLKVLLCYFICTKWNKASGSDEEMSRSRNSTPSTNPLHTGYDQPNNPFTRTASTRAGVHRPVRQTSLQLTEPKSSRPKVPLSSAYDAMDPNY